MGKATCFYLSFTFFVYCSEVIFTICKNEDLISKNLSLSCIIIDSIVACYIIYRLFYSKRIHAITKCIKYLMMIWNIAFFFVIVGLMINYNEVGELILFSHNQLRVFLFHELICILKFYLHIISIIRINRSYCCEEIKYFCEKTNNEDLWQIIEFKGENEEEFYDVKRLEEIKKENRNLKKENKILKEEKIKVDNYTIRNKKIEILIKYIKSKYNINIPKDLLYKKLLLEIKNKHGLIIDAKKYEEIIINYIKQNVFKFLKCPLTNELLENPYITPEGQTFDENKIMEEINKTGLNPITNKNLKPEELIKNKLVLDIVEIVKNHEYDFNIQHFKEIKEKLISNKTKKLYENPYVISIGGNKGDTIEENQDFQNLKKYPNLVIKNIIEHNMEIFDDNLLKFDIELGEDNISTINSDVVKYNIRNLVEEENINDAKRELPFKK